MQNSLWRKGFVVGIIMLFVGAAVIPITNGINQKKSTDINKNFFAHILYVDDDSPPPGNGSQSWPYSEIQYAIDNSNSYYTIIVYPGNYENISLINKNDIILEGINNTNVPFTIIDGNNKDAINTIDIINSNNIIISNFTITGSGQNHDDRSYNYQGIKCLNVGDIIIKNNTIIGNGNGIFVNQVQFGTEFIIEYNLISDNEDNGIRCNSAQSIKIKNNFIQHNGYGPGTVEKNGDGIEAMLHVSSLVIVNNTISYNMVDGIWIETGDSNIIQNNEIYGNEQGGIDLKEVRNSNISNNFIGGSQNFGILLTGSSSANIISNNTISDNKVGISLSNTQQNQITNRNKIRNNNVGLKFYQAMNDIVTGNIIKNNAIGLQILVSFGFKIINNDIYPGLSLFSLVSYGDAMMNYWGLPGRPSTRMIRILSLVIISPWSPFPFFPEYKDISR